MVVHTAYSCYDYCLTLPGIEPITFRLQTGISNHFTLVKCLGVEQYTHRYVFLHAHKLVATEIESTAKYDTIPTLTPPLTPPKPPIYPRPQYRKCDRGT